MMDQSEGKANIREIETLDRAKRALLECRASLLLAVAEGHSEVQKMRFTLEEELPARLKSERRKLQRNFDEAKADLVRAEIVRDGMGVSCESERRNLEKAKRLLERNQRRYEAMKKWANRLEQEFLLFQASMQSISGRADELSRGSELIERSRNLIIGYLDVGIKRTSKDTDEQ